MKKVFFSNNLFTNQTLNLKNNVCFIIGDNGSGKTQILNTLYNGFKGKNKNVKIDEQYINLGDYQVVFLKEFFDIQNEIKISRTSEFRNEIIKVLNKFTINHEKYESLMKKLSSISNEIETIINNNFTQNLSSIINEKIKLKAKLELNSIENIIDKLLKINIYDNKNVNETIIDDDNYSRFILRMLILSILASYTENDQQRPTIFLMDLPELYGTPKLLLKINDYFKSLLKQNNVYLFITTNSPWYLENFCPNVESINVIKQHNILKINDFSKLIMEATIMHSFYESTSNDFVWYKSNISRVFEEEDRIKEESYFYNYAFLYFANSLFADETILVNDFVKKIDNCSNYSYYVNSTLKIHLMLFYLLQKFGNNCIFLEASYKLDKIKYLLALD